MRRVRRWLLIATWLAGNLCLWTILPPWPRFTLPGVPTHTRPAFTADGRRLIVKMADHAETWDVVSGQRLRKVSCPADCLDTIIPSPDGQWLLAYDRMRQESLLIDLATGRE